MLVFVGVADCCSTEMLQLMLCLVGPVSLSCCEVGVGLVTVAKSNDGFIALGLL